MKLDRQDTLDDSRRYDYELDSAIMDVPASEAGFGTPS
jgi:hypothetical protein